MTKVTVSYQFDSNEEAAAFLSGGASVSTASAATETATAEKPAKRVKAASADKAVGYKARHTQTEMQAKLVEVKEKVGKDAAKKLVADSGHDRMADIIDAKVIDSVYDKAQALLDAEDSGEDGEEEDM